MTDIATLRNFDLRCDGTDYPPSACPVIGAYVFRLNELLRHDRRQRLKLFILRVIGNRGPDSEAAHAGHLVRRVVIALFDEARLAEEPVGIA